jgi:hypothetical protein
MQQQLEHNLLKRDFEIKGKEKKRKIMGALTIRAI